MVYSGESAILLHNFRHKIDAVISENFLEVRPVEMSVLLNSRPHSQ